MVGLSLLSSVYCGCRMNAVNNQTRGVMLVMTWTPLAPQPEDANAFVGYVQIREPMGCMCNSPFEGLDPRNVGKIRLGQDPHRRNKITCPVGLSPTGFNFPDSSLFNPLSRQQLPIELHILVEIMPLDEMLQVRQNLRLSQVPSVPRIFLPPHFTRSDTRSSPCHLGHLGRCS